MSQPLQIDYFSDILCVWAWIAQRRIDELQQQWGERIDIRYHYLDLFGDVEQRIEQQWAQRGGYPGYAAHVQQAAAPYETAPVDPAVWQTVRPRSSVNAHLVVKAAEISYGEQLGATLALALRKAFFSQAADIGHLDAVLTIAEAQSLEREVLAERLANGEAAAALARDFKLAQSLTIQGSPSWVMNSGRQTLYGNVGYRVLHANIEELVKKPANEASWC